MREDWPRTVEELEGRRRGDVMRDASGSRT